VSRTSVAIATAWAAWTCLGAEPGPSPQTRVSYSEAYGKSGQATSVAAGELVRFPPVPPDRAIETFQIRKGFRMELVASEPLVVSPVTMAFDEDGRAFVAEMIDYSERREENPHAGRIRMLEDLDGDGRFDRSTVFADNLPWPTALICSRGGLYVGASPDVLWLKDTNGDGKAEERRVVVTGFGNGVARLNVQALLNSFNWGLDHRLYGATGPNGGNRVFRPGSEASALDLRGLDFSFDPLTETIRAETGGGQYGLSFDSVGNRFVCSNSDHLQWMALDWPYASRNPWVALPSPRVSIAADGPAAEVFRISPDEPWRIVRTRWRISGVVPGMVEGGGRVSGYFTGATGATVYRGDAYGADFIDNVFIGDAGGNLVHRKKLHPDGVGWVARRPVDEQGVEFLASRDTWFRPVHFQNGPDGCLYIVDMYREVIEHPWSIPEAIKQHLDLNSGNDRGRIWRVVPEGFQRPAPRRWSQASVRDCVAALESPNGWVRETVSRLIHERQDSSAVLELERLLQKSTVPLARMHALYSLDGLKALEGGRHLQPALADSDERVRRHAVRLAEPRLGRSDSAAQSLLKTLMTLDADPSPRVRWELAFTLGAASGPERNQALVRILLRDGDQSLVQAAVLSGLNRGAGEVFQTLSRIPGFAQRPRSGDFLEALARVLGSQGIRSDGELFLDQMARTDGSDQAPRMVRAFLEASVRSGKSGVVWESDERLQRLFRSARVRAEDESAPEMERVRAVELLAVGRYADVAEPLSRRLEATDLPRVRAAAIQSLGRFNDPGVAGRLLKPWKAYRDEDRTAVVALLSSRPERALALLTAVERGEVAPSEIPAATARALQGHATAAVAKAALTWLPKEPSSADLVVALQPALSLEGSATRGGAIFLERCAACHRAGSDGHAVGPDLVTVRTAGKAKLLTSMVQPHAEVAPQSIAFTVETADGETYSALIARESPTQLTLRLGGGQELNLERRAVRSMRSTGQSLMPEGLLSGLSPQAVADLLEFVAQAPAPVSVPAKP
jgi:putative membrane-bound dehydrogenase-like protein